MLLAGLLALFPRDARAEDSSSRTRWSFDAGYGRRLWEGSGASREERDYAERSKNGLILAGEVSAFPFPWKPLGLGVAYSQFQNDVADPDFGFRDGSRGPLSDSYRIHYTAPAVSLRRDFNRVIAVAQVGAGILYYENRHRAPDFPGVLEGVAPGFHASLSADYRLLRFAGVGLTARVVHGTLENLDYNAIRTDFSAISLTRIDLTAGIRFYP